MIDLHYLSGILHNSCKLIREFCIVTHCLVYDGPVYDGPRMEHYQWLEPGHMIALPNKTVGIWVLDDSRWCDATQFIIPNGYTR